MTNDTRLTIDKPIRIQRKRTKGWKKAEAAVFVGRPTKWGNPFIVGKDGTAEECVAKYADYMLPYRHHGPNSSMDAFYIAQANLESIINELKGKDLMCWCKIGSPCHADWLLEIANSGGSSEYSYNAPTPEKK